jgi:16S rRNA (guanine527-N7)-methyltransferase
VSEHEEVTSPAVPPAGLVAVVAQIAGDHAEVLGRYALALATTGVERGLIGPREAPRLWDRHLLNCAVVGELIPRDASVVDVGSGAGLPGVVLALLRPDLDVTLLEPLARRAAFLAEITQHLELGNARVLRGRAEDVTGEVFADVVTARAVAPLDRLAGWCLPLCLPRGRMLALKGASAVTEIVEHAAAVARVGGGVPRIVECGSGILPTPTTVVEVAAVRSVVPGPRLASGRPGQERSGRGRPDRRRQRG